MDDDTKAEWVALAERLLQTGRDKHDEALSAMRDLVDAQETIARFDWHLAFRGRPRKQYRA